MSALRVLCCGTVLSQGLGGVRRHNVELLPRAHELLARDGGALAVLASREGLAFELPRSIEVVTSNVPAQPALARWSLEARALEATLLRARTAGAPFHLVHTAHLPTPRGLSVPFTLLLHDLKTQRGPQAGAVQRWIGRSVLRDALARAAGVACVSRALADELPLAAGRVVEHLAVVPNGCDHLPLLPRAPSAQPFLLYVGRLEPRKNVARILHALAADANLPELRLAGDARGGHDRVLRALASSLGVDARVRFLGPQDDRALAELFAGAQCVVLPSLREGFDIPLVEALRAGAPVAASDLAVHRELAGQRARYFAPDSSEQCVEAIRSARPAQNICATWDDAARALVELWRRVARA